MNIRMKYSVYIMLCVIVRSLCVCDIVGTYVYVQHVEYCLYCTICMHCMGVYVQ